MNIFHSSRRLQLLLAAFAFLAAGCATTSSPSRYFMLNALAQKTEPARSSPAGDKASLSFQPVSWPGRPKEELIVVAVGPLTIPDSINRPEIVTSDASRQISIHDMERWAGPLDKKVLRVLTDDLDAQLGPEKFTVVVWNPSTQVNIEARYRVMVEVTRFELSKEPGGAARFEADWVLYGPQNKVLAMRQSRRQATVTGTNLKALVAAMSQCILEFSGEVAQTISGASV